MRTNGERTEEDKRVACKSQRQIAPAKTGNQRNHSRKGRRRGKTPRGTVTALEKNFKKRSNECGNWTLRRPVQAPGFPGFGVERAQGVGESINVRNAGEAETKAAVTLEP